MRDNVEDYLRTSDTTYWMLCETVMQPAVRKLVVFARLDSSWPVLLYCPEYKQEHSGQQDEEIFIGLPTSLQTETHRNVPIETNEGTHTDLFDYLEGSQWNKEKPPVTSGSWNLSIRFQRGKNINRSNNIINAYPKQPLKQTEDDSSLVVLK
uniref:uncharacterized protein LOC127067746 isoform X1 n=1 Tax=Vespula vulgaris TaxID=7454 RepID=UPI00223B7E2B|nr:uncharacterized protein LOC127067746 isoform X1 [Vespula vulgaris]